VARTPVPLGLSAQPAHPARARSPFLSLSWRARPVGAAASPARAPAPSLSLLVGPLCQLPRPRVTALPSCAHRELRAHVARRALNRPALGHLSPRAPLTLPLPQLRTCRASFQPPTLRARQGGAAVVRRRPKPVSPSMSEPCRALCHGELCLDVRNSGHALISPLPP
jgi:hypothetical protein